MFRVILKNIAIWNVKVSITFWAEAGIEINRKRGTACEVPSPFLSLFQVNLSVAAASGSCQLLYLSFRLRLFRLLLFRLLPLLLLLGLLRSSFFNPLLPAVFFTLHQAGGSLSPAFLRMPYALLGRLSCRRSLQLFFLWLFHLSLFLLFLQFQLVRLALLFRR
jgi:hypothetical protein